MFCDPAKKAYSWWIRLVASPTIFCNSSSTTDVLTTCGFSSLGSIWSAKLTHFSTAPLRTPTIPRFKQSLLTCGEVQPNPGPQQYYSVSLPRLHVQRHEPRSQLPVPQLFWLGAFEMF